MTDPAPRVPLITDDQRTDEVRKMFAAFEQVGGKNLDHHHVMKTYAQHPALSEPLLTFNAHLLGSSTLPVRLRQIAILRVAWTRRCRYMWASHLMLSLYNDFVEADFEAVKTGAASSHWSELERAVLTATDQLRDTSDLDDAAWTALELHLERRQIMDLLFTVGAYVMLAMAMNAMRIEREPHLIELAERYGSP